jgi:predicted PurR-regulated permease PerM
MLKEDVVIERTNSWRDRFRKLLVSDEKKLGSYFAVVVVVVVCLGCFIIIYLIIIYMRIIFG